MKPNVIGGTPLYGLVQEYTDFVDVIIVFRLAQVHAFIQLVYSASQALRIGEPNYWIAMANTRKPQPGQQRPIMVSHVIVWIHERTRRYAEGRHRGMTLRDFLFHQSRC